MAITQKLRGRQLKAGRGVIGFKGTGGASPGALSGHCLLIAFGVDAQTAFPGNVVGQVEWEAIRVVKRKCHFAGNFCALQLAQSVF